MAQNITLYHSAISPYTHRVELALHEADVPYKKFEIDLKNKPEWFVEKVNPVGKIPAITYGGPEVPPDRPSPSSAKIAESLIILEFIADISPNSTLLPKDPVARAKVRFFIDAVHTKIESATIAFIARGESPESLYKAYEELQELIVKDGGKFAVGDEFTIADAAFLPLLAMAEAATAHDIGGYAKGEGPKALAVFRSPKYSKLWSYFQALKTRKSFKDTFNEETAVAIFGKRFETRE